MVLTSYEPQDYRALAILVPGPRDGALVRLGETALQVRRNYAEAFAELYPDQFCSEIRLEFWAGHRWRSLSRLHIPTREEILLMKEVF